MRERLTATDPEERAAAVADLQTRVGDDPEGVRELLPELAGLLEDPEETVRTRASALVRALADAGHLEPAVVGAQLAAGLDVTPADRAVERLLEELRGALDRASGGEPYPPELAVKLLASATAADPVEADSVVDVALAAAEREALRADAMSVLYHASRRNPDAVDAEQVLPYADDPDPSVRGDAVAIVGYPSTVVTDDGAAGDAVVEALGDEDPAVRQTALGVLERLVPDAVFECSYPRLGGALSGVSPLRSAEDPEISERADRVAEALSDAVWMDAVRTAVSPAADHREEMADALVAAAGADATLARRVAGNAPYQAGKPDGEEALAEELLTRIVAEHPSRFDSVAALREAATAEEEPSHDVVATLAADLANATGE